MVKGNNQKSQHKLQTQSISLSLSPLSVEILDKLSKELGLSRSSLVEQALQSLGVHRAVIELLSDRQRSNSSLARFGLALQVGKQVSPDEETIRTLQAAGKLGDVEPKRKSIRLELTPEAIKIFEGLAASAKLPRAQFLDEVVRFPEIQDAIRAELGKTPNAFEMVRKLFNENTDNYVEPVFQTNPSETSWPPKI